ncbi:hypothetical protein VC83_05802 [Pseudogymnoascus destructans]|uniref:Core Histone H2A/H2B/H3 domain-containing protein n=1 Tax=Pseudogymnoascus destructans TaxID=655981 RepID=A0A177A4C9_9PEZI|nr:uncharacterized protein VC83_05802 [Pseudogymnoascus destructans]OAF56977.1 hypothetical protein VC83_05802 [Pseudogymnoascus destructans]
MDLDAAYDAPDPVTSSESETEPDGKKAPLKQSHKFMQLTNYSLWSRQPQVQPALEPNTPTCQSARLQLQTPPATQHKVRKGPIPTFAPGQKFSKKMPAQKTAGKAPRKTSGISGKKIVKKAAKKSRRYKPGTVALRQIKHDLRPREDFRLQSSAISALQEAAETTLVKEFEMTQLAAIHAKRVTIQQKDMKLVQQVHLHMTGFSFSGQLK